MIDDRHLWTRRRWVGCGLTLVLGAGRLEATETPVPLIEAERIIQLPVLHARRHSTQVTAVAIAPDGRSVSAGGDDQVVRIWSLPDGRLLQQLNGHEGWVRSVAYSADGSRLITAGNDRRVMIWDPAGGRRLGGWTQSDGVTEVVCCGHQSPWLATAGFCPSLTLYQLSTGDVIRQLQGPCHDVRSLAIAPDDRFLAAGGRNGVVQVWDTSTGQRVAESRPHRQRIRGMAFTNDGRHLISAGEDRMVRRWNWSQAAEAESICTAPGKVMALCVFADGRLATAGTDNVIRLWELATGQPLARCVGHEGSVVALSSHGQYLVSGAYDTTLRIWRLPPATAPMYRSARSSG